MVNVKRAAQAVARLGALKFFPTDPHAQTGIVQIVCEMAADDSQVDWLVNRMIGLYNDWPGPRELRACFCSRFKPKDGRECHSMIYVDGIPSEREEINRLVLGVGHAKGLIEGRQEERGPMQVGIDPAIKAAAHLKDLNLAVRRIRLAQTEKPINPNYRPITQAEIDQAVRKNRDEAAKGELGV